MNLPRTIYAITHNKTNRTYVGSSANLKTRINAHFNLLRCGKHPVEDMQADFDDHGDDFTVRILGTITNWEDRKQEYEWMQKYQSHQRGVGYNYKDNAIKNSTPTLKEQYVEKIGGLLDQSNDVVLLDLILHLLQKSDRAVRR